MQQIKVKADIDVNHLLSNLQTDELEMVIREASAMLTQRKTLVLARPQIPLHHLPVMLQMVQLQCRSARLKRVDAP